MSQAPSSLSEVCRFCGLYGSVDSLPHAPGLKAFSPPGSDMEQFPKIPAGETEISDVPCLPLNVNLHFTNHRSSESLSILCNARLSPQLVLMCINEEQAIGYLEGR